MFQDQSTKHGIDALESLQNWTVTAETSVIGGILINKGAVCAFTDLQPEWFENELAREAFTELREFWKKEGRIDGGAVIALKCKEYALRCAETLPAVSMPNIKAWIKAVSDGYKVRKMQGIAVGMIQGGVGIEEIMEGYTSMTKIINEQTEDSGWQTMADGFRDFHIRQTQQKQEYMKCFVFPSLDKKTYISQGDYVIIGGRPSAGKTMVSLNFAYGWACGGKKIAYFSLETKPSKLFDRLMAIVYNFSFSDIKNGTVDMKGAIDDYKAFADLKIYICNASGKSVEWMRAETQRIKADVAIIDYIGLIRGEGNGRYEQMTNVSISLHEWAQRDKVVVVGLCQLSRQGADEPKLTDLRESGQIEQDADLVMLLHKDDDRQTYSITVAKNKEGEVGRIECYFDGVHQTVREIDMGHNG